MKNLTSNPIIAKGIVDFCADNNAFCAKVSKLHRTGQTPWEAAGSNLHHKSFAFDCGVTAEVRLRYFSSSRYEADGDCAMVYIYDPTRSVDFLAKFTLTVNAKTKSDNGVHDQLPRGFNPQAYGAPKFELTEGDVQRMFTEISALSAA